MDLWNNQSGHPERNYILQREFMYYKFLVFDNVIDTFPIPVL